MGVSHLNEITDKLAAVMEEKENSVNSSENVNK
jgi:hypothetical protein